LAEKGDEDYYKATSDGSTHREAVTQRWFFCIRGKGSWSDEDWQDDCTARGWQRVGGNFAGYQFPDPRPNLSTTELCALDTAAPQNAFYFAGNGWMYQQRACSQDRDGDSRGHAETRVQGVPNCHHQGLNPMYKPKWVDPRRD